MAVQAEAREPVINIHPTAFIAPGAVVLGDVTLGPHASVWYTAVLRGDTAPIVVGASSNIQDGTIIHVDAGVPATVGARVGVGHRVVLHGCTVEDECLIGMGSVLLNRAHIGQGSVVAAGAVVPEGLRVPPGSVLVGVPARVTRQVDDELRARIRATWEHYVQEAERHRSGVFPLARTDL
ncbi:MAG TPA: gamma carbonic anhydrase family protein [Gemmatimonadales bacterium]|nr:gamma carbonic anhydrase family protein [Gemmatimonadales bacterium]